VTTMLKKIGKMLGGASTFAALLAVALLSAVLGCGGQAVDPTSTNNNVVINAASNSNLPVGTFAMTIRNNSNKNLVSINYSLLSSTLDANNNPVVTVTPTNQIFNPEIRPGGSIAAQIVYNTPGIDEAMTLSLVLRDSTAASQGFNLIIENSAGTTTITPPTGIFSYN